MPQRYLKLKTYKIKWIFHTKFIHISVFHWWMNHTIINTVSKTRKTGFLMASWGVPISFTPYVVIFIIPSNILNVFLLLSIYTFFSIETHNFHLNYPNNFSTYLPASFMTSCDPQCPRSHKNLFPKLKICYYTFRHKAFQWLWNTSKNVHFETCFNYFITNIKSTNSYELSTVKRSSSKYCWINQTLK